MKLDPLPYPDWIYAQCKVCDKITVDTKVLPFGFLKCPRCGESKFRRLTPNIRKVIFN